MTTQAQPQTMQMSTNIGINQQVHVGLLDSSGSTGYHWTVSVEPSQGLQISDEMFFPKNALVGAPAVREYTLVAGPTPNLNPTYRVTFTELPPSGTDAVNTVHLTINVTP